MTIRLRGHHVWNIEFYLLKKDENSLRKLGRFDYDSCFRSFEKDYDRIFPKNLWKMHNSLIENNLSIKVINKEDDACKAKCPYLIGKDKKKCSNTYVGESPEEHTIFLKNYDNECIEGLGLNMEEEIKFSKLFRILVNRNYDYFGFQKVNDLKENIDYILHPKLVKLYKEG